MSSCCDRTVGALLGCAAAGTDPMRDLVYRQRLDRLRRQLRQFRLEQRPRTGRLFKFTNLSLKTSTWRKTS
jgi:hypothetical protein